MYVVHIKTSVSAMEKTGLLYILKLVMFTTEKRKKNGYMVHTKTSMFTIEIRKKRYIVHIKTSMFTTDIREKRVCRTY